MRPAGATLRLFAQWLHPTTNKGKTNPSGLAFFCLLPSVYGGCCGFLRTAERTFLSSNNVFLSELAHSLSAYTHPNMLKSPQDSIATSI
jgi:hypothetical protein